MNERDIWESERDSAWRYAIDLVSDGLVDHATILNTVAGICSTFSPWDSLEFAGRVAKLVGQ